MLVAQMHDLSRDRSQTISKAAPLSWTKWYILFLLTFLNVVNYFDRQIIFILSDSIKKGLALSDTQLGLISGTAFGLLYAFLGIPIARFADSHSRRSIISGALLFWSGFTALCGLAQSFAILFAARVGVGVGEAGAAPPAQSIISDYFRYDRRALALAIFNAGLPIGGFLGFLIGGYLNDLVGWRHTLMVAAVPGVILALLIRTTLREPVRGEADGETKQRETLPFRVAAGMLFGSRAYLAMVSAGACALFILYVTNAWLPALFIRSHGLATREIGAWLGLGIGVFGTLGIMGGGVLADMLKKRWASAEYFVAMFGFAATIPAFLVTVLARDVNMALGAMMILYLFAYFWLGPLASIGQVLAPVRSRALSVGLTLFIANCVSLTLGPAIIGMLSDHYAPVYGSESLRHALIWTVLVPPLGIVLLWIGSRIFSVDRERLDAFERQDAAAAMVS